MRQLMLVRDIILPMRTEANEAREFLRRLEREGLVIGTDERARRILQGVNSNEEADTETGEGTF